MRLARPEFLQGLLHNDTRYESGDPFEHWREAMSLKSLGEFRPAVLELVAFFDACNAHAKSDLEVFFVGWAGRALQEMGHLFLHNLNRIDFAVSAYSEAAAVFRSAGHTVNEAANINNAGDALLRDGKVEEAKASYLRANELLEDQPYGRGHSIVTYNLSVTSLQLNQSDQCLSYARKGLETAQVAGDLHWVTRFEHLLAQISKTSEEVVGAPASGTAAAEVLEMERRFRADFDGAVHLFCTAARDACHQAQKSLNKEELTRVSSLPVTSFPMGNLNACICRLQSGESFVNISPEFSLGVMLFAEILAHHMNGTIDSGEFARQIDTLVLSLSLAAFPFKEAGRVVSWSEGNGIWKVASEWVALHEYGHLLLGHLENTPLRPVVGGDSRVADIRVYQMNSRAREVEADRFATERSSGGSILEYGESGPRFLMYSVGALLGLSGAVRAVNAGLRGAQTAFECGRAHPEAAERLHSVRTLLGTIFPDRKREIGLMADAWEFLCLSPSSADAWFRKGLAKNGSQNLARTVEF